jgi:hypothetical protein
VTVVAVGVATLLSRGIPAAAFHTVPLAAVYLFWSRAWSSSLDAQVQSRVALGSILEWIAEGLLQSLLAFAGSPAPEPREPLQANPTDPILSRRANPGLILPIHGAWGALWDSVGRSPAGS